MVFPRHRIITPPCPRLHQSDGTFRYRHSVDGGNREVHTIAEGLFAAAAFNNLPTALFLPFGHEYDPDGPCCELQ